MAVLVMAALSSMPSSASAQPRPLRSIVLSRAPGGYVPLPPGIYDGPFSLKNFPQLAGATDLQQHLDQEHVTAYIRGFHHGATAVLLVIGFEVPAASDLSGFLFDVQQGFRTAAKGLNFDTFGLTGAYGAIIRQATPAATQFELAFAKGSRVFVVQNAVEGRSNHFELAVATAVRQADAAPGAFVFPSTSTGTTQGFSLTRVLGTAILVGALSAVLGTALRRRRSRRGAGATSPMADNPTTAPHAP